MKQIKWILVLVATILLVVLLLIFKTDNNEKEEVVVSHEMLVKQIEELGNLEVLKYTIQDIMQYEKKRKWLPNSQVQMKIVGEVIACVDLSKIRHQDIYTDGDSVHIVLPMPEVCHYKVDHSKSKVYDVDFGLWQTADLVDDAYAQAEKQLYAEALRMGIALQSRQNAIKVLQPILGGLGFRRIQITFKTSAQTNSEYQQLRIE